MNPFLILFSIITVISVLISGALLLMRRKIGGRWRSQEHIHPSVFAFFTTLYAFFIGFAMVTLWSAFLTAKTNVAREAESMMIVFRLSEDVEFTLSLARGHALETVSLTSGALERT